MFHKSAPGLNSTIFIDDESGFFVHNSYVFQNELYSDLKKMFTNIQINNNKKFISYTKMTKIALPLKHLIISTLFPPQGEEILPLPPPILFFNFLCDH